MGPHYQQGLVAKGPRVSGTDDRDAVVHTVVFVYLAALFGAEKPSKVGWFGGQKGTCIFAGSAV